MHSISQSLTDCQEPVRYILVTVFDPSGPNFHFSGKAIAQGATVSIETGPNKSDPLSLFSSPL